MENKTQPPRPRSRSLNRRTRPLKLCGRCSLTLFDLRPSFQPKTRYVSPRSNLLSFFFFLLSILSLPPFSSKSNLQMIQAETNRRLLQRLTQLLVTQKAEVNYLGDLVHPNLVKLIGYCIEDDQRLLVYEFMPRGSLENHLFRRSLPLPWSIRMKIALGAAKGLAFLHEEAERPVIYRDFKTSNILLDADYNAKLSDFGLAKDGTEGDKTHVSTRVMGTYGYAAPEYVMTGYGKSYQQDCDDCGAN